MRMTIRTIIAILAAANLAAAAVAKRAPLPDEQPPATIRGLLDCRAIAAPDARLACYDKQAGALADAEQKHDLVVVDRQQIRDARRSLFGFTLPKLAIFGGGDKNRPEEPEFTQIETTIGGAHQNGEGKWVITLADGAQWIQIDDRDPLRSPAPGMKISIRKASLGSYFANVDGQTAMRMHRVG
jgi:hypothetical protein